MRKGQIIAGAVLATVVLAVVLGNGFSSPEAMCEQAFKKMYGDVFQGFVVQEKVWNRISYDLSGYYNNGEWACALSNNPMEFRSGKLFPRDSMIPGFDISDIN